MKPQVVSSTNAPSCSCMAAWLFGVPAAYKNTELNLKFQTATTVAPFVAVSTIMDPNPLNHRCLRQLGFDASYGGRNFRDIGGYLTADGQHRVKYGIIYRHGRLSEITGAEKEHLDGLGIKSIVDFRADYETRAHPVYAPRDARVYALKMQDPAKPKTAAAGPPQGLARQHPLAFNFDPSVMRGHFEANEFGALPRYKEAMPRVYRQLASGRQRLDRFAEFLALAADRRNWPLSFMCNAGKDRTGVAAALVLTAVGVPEATVLEDYLLSNECLRVRGAVRKRVAKLADSAAAGGQRVSQADLDAVEEALGSVEGVSINNIQNALALMKQQHGSVMGFMEAELGLTAAMVRALKDGLLERADCPSGPSPSPSRL
jgi:protein-tyrosine phosphatase